MTAALIKFLGGLQTGSEAVLPPGEYVLGADDTADLVLVDVAVQPRHAVLRIGDPCAIEPVDGAEVRLDGVIIAGTSPVLPYQVLSFGGVHIALGPDGPWEKLPEPPRPRTKPETPETPGTVGSTAGAGSGRAESAPPRRSFMPVLWLLLGLTAVFAAVYGYPHLFPQDPTVMLAEQVRQRLAAAGFLVQQGEAGEPPAGVLAVMPAGTGRLRLTGLLATETERRRAAEAARLSEIPLDDGTESVEAQAGLLAEKLGGTHPGLTVACLCERFLVQLAGVAEPAAAESAQRIARESLDSRIGIRRKIWPWRELAREAERVARRLGIEDARFVRDAEGVHLLSDASPLASPVGLELAETLVERFGEEIGLLLASGIAREAPPATAPEEDIPQVLHDALPSLSDLHEEPEGTELPETAVKTDETADVPEPAQPPPLPDFWHVSELYKEGFRDHTGKVWRMGDTLPNGWRVAATWHGGIVLQRGDDLLFVQRGTTLFAENDSTTGP